MFRRFKEKRERAQVERRRAALEAEASELAAKADRVDRLADLLAAPAEIWDETGPGSPIIAKRGEEFLQMFRGVSLVELRTQKRNYRGSSHGLSIRIAKGVYYRPGIHAGSITETGEVWKPLDEGGDMVITNQRIVYVGTRYSREFPFAKLLSWGLALEREALGSPHYLVTLPVTIRVRTSAIAFPAAVDDDSRERLVSVVQCGIALHNGTHEDFIRHIRSDVSDLRSQAREARNQLLSLS